MRALSSYKDWQALSSFFVSLYFPALSARLLSVATIYDHGGRVKWGKQVVRLYGRGHKQPLLVCHRVGDAWVLRAPVLFEQSTRPSPPDCQLCLQAAARVVQGSGPADVLAPWV